MTVKMASKCVSKCVCVLFLQVCLIVLCRSQDSVITYHIPEEQDIGWFVGNLARDSTLYLTIDESEFQRMKFNFFTQGNPYVKLFHMDEKSSTIRTAEVIDREEVCSFKILCEMKLEIAVYIRDPKRGTYDLYKLMQVKMVVDDINDNTPMFPHKVIHLSVPESVPVNHRLLASGAIDKDMGQNNSVQEYQLIPRNGMFGLDVVKNLDGSADLAIIVKHRLDRETRDFFQLMVKAMDGGMPQKTGSAIINITVTDVNDNRPAFLDSTFNVSIQENKPKNSTVVVVSAVDQDAGSNGKISYYFSQRVSQTVRQSFAIDEKTGIVFANGPIDYETQTQFQFMVEAKDHGNPSLSSLAAVIINILDVNDNYPHISINLAPEASHISEGMETGKFIAHVSVSDADVGMNSLVMCSLNDHHFALEKFYENLQNIYKVVLAQRLDHETAATHKVTITCKDQGDPPKSNSTSFIITVMDENDNAPVFSGHSYSGSIIENNSVGEEILQVTANDWDGGENGRVTYSLDSAGKNYFSIIPDTGIIKAIKSIDRERYPELHFHVVATDHGQSPKSSSSAVSIDVIDQNDEPPRFTKPVFFCYVQEHKPVGTKAGNVSAYDPDNYRNAEYIYKLAPDSKMSEFFSVDTWNGIITTLKEFDREKQHMFNFSVIVQDSQVPSFRDVANVSVFILDANDHKPMITYPSQSNNSVSVPYNTQIHTVIAHVKAHDTDDMTYSRLYFKITEGNSRNIFHIDRISGELEVSSPMMPIDAGSHQLIIAVQDNGNPPKTAYAELNIIVTANGTAATLNSSKDDNMLIVIILVAVTVVLTLAILTTICMIKRIDKDRQRTQVVVLKGEDEKMFDEKKRDSFSSVSRDSNENEDAEMKKKNGRKEVSFTFDEDKEAHNTSGSSGIGSFSTFRCQNPEQQDPNNLQDAPSHGIPTSDSDIPSPAPDQADRQWAPPTNGVEARTLLEILKKNEIDVSSEMSGETGTSDSGHGGSEEDLHAKTGQAQETEETKPGQFFPTTFHGGSSRVPVYNDGRQSRNGRKTAPSTLRGSRSQNFRSQPQQFPSNPRTFETMDNGYHYNTAPHPPRSAQADNVLHTFSSPKSECKHFQPRHLDFVPGSSRGRPETPIRIEEDRSSTSGSYTLNSNRRTPDIDHMMFNSDVVV
ncbi:protocadherin-11 X-linked-like isoform X1 [Haliotis cracherodii]|uniref:protocadherin-11 X-linked-like isoform X1 n=1 Tax=Haliotis cracherodii TaxID=6455 RepID=UPI0039EC3DAC